MAKSQEPITLAEMPEVLTAQHISRHLDLSPKRVYELFDLSVPAGGIPAFRIGGSRRAMKSDYLKWIADRQSNAM